jgi:predicted peroxiredoxin
VSVLPINAIPRTQQQTRERPEAGFARAEAPVATEVDVPHWIEIASELPLHSQAHQTFQEPLGGAWRNSVIMLVSGPEDGGRRATLAFAAACTALSLDLNAQVFLIGDGSHWAYAGASDGVHQKGFPPLAELIDTFLDLGGEVSICSACDGVCSLPGADGDARRRRQEIQPRGLAAVLAHLVGGTSLTF